MLLRALVVLHLLALVLPQDLQQCTQCIQQSKTWCPEAKTCEDSTTKCKSGVKLLLNCPRLPDPAYAYNETFARYYITPIVAGVYAKSPALCLKAQIPHASYYQSVRVKCATETPDVHCHGYTAWDPVEKAVIISFEGTDGSYQMTDEILSFFTDKVAFFDNGHLFKYFHNAFFFLWNGGLEQQVRTLKYQYPDYKVYFPYAYRIVHQNDPVPHIPPRLGRDKLFHHRYEVWYNNNMAVGQPYTICQEADGDYCSNTVISDAFSEHLYYFDKNIGEWGGKGCP
ncbi:triacylglycerol lipase [Ancylostoma caninum]|uniref:Triacylglycerol lipase n=1 Tax=Ancylostoma caninum TaxID=29170 RepID=A0A368G6J3_ANCCA|nr:triacylglycerol lipase [Ancylostoma caninum]